MSDGCRGANNLLCWQWQGVFCRWSQPFVVLAVAGRVLPVEPTTCCVGSGRACSAGGCTRWKTSFSCAHVSHSLQSVGHQSRFKRKCISTVRLFRTISLSAVVHFHGAVIQDNLVVGKGAFPQCGWCPQSVMLAVAGRVLPYYAAFNGPARPYF